MYLFFCCCAIFFPCSCIVALWYFFIHSTSHRSHHPIKKNTQHIFENVENFAVIFVVAVICSTICIFMDLFIYKHIKAITTTIQKHKKEVHFARFLICNNWLLYKCKNNYYSIKCWIKYISIHTENCLIEVFWKFLDYCITKKLAFEYFITYEHK